MSADSVAVPSGEPVPNFSTAHIAHDAVDAFEITARLEASGLTDRSVRRHHGAADVFAYAQTLIRVHPHGARQAPQGPRGWLGRGALLEAVRRGLVLILGAVLGGITATMLAANTREVLVAGIGAWVVGQSVSGVVWAYAGAGHLRQGIARGLGATLIVTAVLACYMAVSLALPGLDATQAGLLMAWCWYSCIVSMLVILGRTWFLLIVLTIAVSLVTVSMVLNQRTGLVVSTAIVVVAVITLLFGAEFRGIRERRVPSRGDWRAAAAPAAQAAFLAAALSLALTRLPTWEGTALIVATVVAAAATDPALVLMRQRLLWSSQRTPLLKHAAWNAWFLTMLISAAIVLISASVSALVVVLLVDETKIGTTATVAAIFSSLATTSTTLNAFGVSRGSVLFAGAASLSAAAWILVGDATGVLVAVAFLVAGIAVLLTRVSDPRTYA